MRSRSGWLVSAVCGVVLVPVSEPVWGQSVIAHRGASAYLPEHTLEAYTLAYGMGADYIEPDVVLTRDGVLICVHDLTMERVTDVEARFPQRAREDGSWYWIDFDLAEVKTLRKWGTRPPAAGQQGGVEGYQVATLAEMLGLVRRLNETLGARTGREVGVIPEPKAPAFHLEEGQPIEAALLEELESFGYVSQRDEAIIQCFDLESLRRFDELRAEQNGGLRLVWLLNDEPTQRELALAIEFCIGLGPRRGLLVDEAGQPSRFHAAAKAFGFELYPYTFRGDYGRVREEIRHAFEVLMVDGVFTDNPDAGVAAKE